MKLYHGSQNGNLKTIKKMQARAGDNVKVPEDELKKGIYLTPHYDFALAMAARPEGVTYIDNEKKKPLSLRDQNYLIQNWIFMYMKLKLMKM